MDDQQMPPRMLMQTVLAKVKKLSERLREFEEEEKCVVDLLLLLRMKRMTHSLMQDCGVAQPALQCPRGELFDPARGFGICSDPMTRLRGKTLQVVDKGAGSVLDEIEATVLEISTTILEVHLMQLVAPAAEVAQPPFSPLLACLLQGNGFSFDIPSRAKGNQVIAPADCRPPHRALTHSVLAVPSDVRCRAGPHRAQGLDQQAALLQHADVPQDGHHHPHTRTGTWGKDGQSER